ncbi:MULTISPECIES: hypothetical protein [Methylobacterium]|uniref:Uncharacterized protein n=1 Tax=Methylobacterium thuringiense TaxID=1003091 RepID=A0ABQ4TE44_9HYPH|nr:MULTISPECIES: hypothetical protein [Methylobacterium]TXN23534.1 hypothetical protein FV217_06625 [Methylobacterium sp. WL9]GJE53635.1 hypothetical protein EKPJFOCH_0101 [Methylobacterium thuringiense]
MAEAARRTGYGHGSDVVRRLIARPIRMRATPAVRTVMPDLEPAQPAAITPGIDETDAPPSDIARLRTEMMLLKAVLMAERRENASLRACVGFDDADQTLGDEARAVRDRWATLVDRLLHPSA